MDVKILFNRILQDNRLIHILKKLKMHHVKDKGKYITCGFPDGDGETSATIYKDTLHVEAYTRDIKDKYGYTNLLSLVIFIKEIYFINAIKWLCDTCEYDYYNEDYEQPKILQLLNEIRAIRKNNININIEVKTRILDINILKTYYSICNKMFFNDGIDYKTQIEFQLGYDFQTHRITIPIFDEINQLVGVKGRFAGNLNFTDSKYLYLFSCNKNKILFGLNKTYDHIQKKRIVYVAESEKAVMQGWANGIKNVVSIGGHILSPIQVKKLTHLGVEICLCYDDKANFIEKKDKLTCDKDFYINEEKKFINGIKVTCIIDEHNEILGNKESPFDNLDLWDELLEMKRIII